MQVPFHNGYNNQRFPPPSNFHGRPNFGPRGHSPRFRTPTLHWRQLSPQEHANEFWCETCDRGFRTPDILEQHKQQHQKCNIDGCQFIAHPKVITKHIQMQHASGLYKKIAKLQDPEEIRKWREERKRKYPTKENVEKAAAAMKEKIARGEKMGLKNNREKNIKTGQGAEKGNRKHLDRRNPRTSHHNNQNLAPNSKRRKPNPRNSVKKLPIAEDTRKLKPFAGIQELMMDAEEHLDEPKCSFSIEDEEEVAETEVVPDVASAPMCLALSSLICNYGSSDEDENQNEIAPIVSNAFTTSNIKSQNDKNINSQEDNRTVNLSVKNVEKPTPVETRNDSDDDSGPEEVKVTKAVINEALETKPTFNKKKPRDNVTQKLIQRRPKPKLPSTLLHKLLFKEIKHERNIVLQCIRHIIKNNFFDKSVSM